MRSGVCRATGAATLIAAVAALAGCGSSGSKGEPSSLVPSSAPLYASFAVKPSGGSSGEASTAAKKLTHLAEPYGSLAQALLQSEGSHVEFKRDIESWVGKDAGLFLTSLDTSKLPQSSSSLQSLLEGGLTSAASSLGADAFGSSATQGAIVLETSDVLVERARSLKNWHTNRVPIPLTTGASATKCPPREPPRASSRTSP